MLLKTLIAGVAILVAVTQAAVAGAVSGLVTDELGAPLPGVNVEVVYQTYNSDDLPNGGESIKQSAVTDESGRYTISTEGMPPGEYSANAYQVVENGGKQINIDFRAEDPSTFAGNADTVRNFTGGFVESTPDNPYGNGGIFLVNNDIGDFTDLSSAEVTLTHVETGKTYQKTVRSTGEGLVVTGIPFGSYRAEVRVNGQPMQIRLWGPGTSDTFADSVTHDFTMGWLGNQFSVAVKP
jgi:hypothetical protein